MRFVYNEKELIKNPCVLKVDKWKLTLRTDFKIELFELWRNGEMDKLEQRLTENGFIPGVVDSYFARKLITSFKNSGYPTYKGDEIVFSSGKMLEHPLIKSGKFEVSPNKRRFTDICSPSAFSYFAIFPLLIFPTASHQDCLS